MRIKVSGGQFFADGFAVRKSFEIREGEERLLSCISEAGTGCATLRMRGEAEIVRGAGIELVRRRHGVEVRPAPRRERSVWRRTFREGGSFLQVLLVTGERPFLRIEGAATYEREIPFPLADPTCEFITGQREKILEIRATSERMEYISFLAVTAGGATLLLEEVGEKITCVGNEVTVVRTFPDLRGRKRINRYLWRGEAFESSREYLCANAQSFIREEAGRLLLEAVIAGDEEDTKTLLSPDLTSFAALRSYFGEPIALLPPGADDPPTALLAEYREKECVREVLYDFDFDSEGKITNIRREE